MYSKEIIAEEKILSSSGMLVVNFFWCFSNHEHPVVVAVEGRSKDAELAFYKTVLGINHVYTIKNRGRDWANRAIWERRTRDLCASWINLSPMESKMGFKAVSEFLALFWNYPIFIVKLVSVPIIFVPSSSSPPVCIYILSHQLFMYGSVM